MAESHGQDDSGIPFQEWIPAAGMLTSHSWQTPSETRITEPWYLAKWVKARTSENEHNQQPIYWRSTYQGETSSGPHNHLWNSPRLKAGVSVPFGFPPKTLQRAPPLIDALG